MNKKRLYISSAVIVIILAGYYFFSTKQQTQSIILNNPTSPIATSIPDWDTCNYPSFGFKLNYPKNWKVSVFSKAQGGGDVGPIVITCGEINASQLLGQILFGSTADSGENMGMKINIRASKNTSSNATDAKNILLTTDSAVYDGHQYTISFGASVSTSTRNSILQSFEFTSQS